MEKSNISRTVDQNKPSQFSQNRFAQNWLLSLLETQMYFLRQMDYAVKGVFDLSHRSRVEWYYLQREMMVRAGEPSAKGERVLHH